MTIPAWATPETIPPLVAGEVHVWRMGLDAPAERLASLQSRLSPDELERADRFYFEIDRGRYIVAHAALRTLLAGYLGREHADPFLTGPNGKPSLPGDGLRFNLAHSRNLGLLAVSGDCEVGVDLEGVDRDVEVEHLAERFFSAPECRALRGLPAGRRREGFFHIWSQKEAYLKGRGEGVTGGLDHFDVEARPDLPARLLADRRDPGAADRWVLDTIDVGPGYRGALAADGGPRRIRCFTWR